MREMNKKFIDCKHLTRDAKGFFLLILIFISLFSIIPPIQSETISGLYHYIFIVDEKGFTNITINFTSREREGSSWVFVPKYISWSNLTLSGYITNYSIIETQSVVGEDYYFYEVFNFSYKSEGVFTLLIQFSMPTGALILNQHGIFLSTQIGFHPKDEGEAEVSFPDTVEILRAVVFGENLYKPKVENETYASFNLYENLVRVEVEFKTEVKPEHITLKHKAFTFRTEKKYENYASKILNLLDRVYENFTYTFNTPLEEVNLTFFLPSFESLLSIGGYIPFSEGKLGDIHINLFFVRTINGSIEVITLHELVHHFLWKAGISPKLLWFHEGMAQYVSIEIAKAMGYEGAFLEEKRLEKVVSQLIKLRGENFDFLQFWKPEFSPIDLSFCYAASYYVIRRLAEKYGGFTFFNRFFKVLEGVKIEDNNRLIQYLSLAANESLVSDLENWGFTINLYVPSLLYEATKALRGLSSIFIIENLLAKYLYERGLASFERGEIDEACQYFKAVIIIVKIAPLISIAVLVMVLALAFFLISRYKRSKVILEEEYLFYDSSAFGSEST